MKEGRSVEKVCSKRLAGFFVFVFVFPVEGTPAEEPAGREQRGNMGLAKGELRKRADLGQVILPPTPSHSPAHREASPDPQ